jgi:hypothetical protein
MAHPTNQKQAFGPVPERVSFIVEWAGEPARKRLIENGAISHITSGAAGMISNPRFIVLIKSNPEANK